MSISMREDIAYGDPAPIEANYERALDLYVPVAKVGESQKAHRAAIVVIHGGGWMSQTRKGRRERSIASDLAEEGFVAASIDYTLVDLDHPERSGGAWPQMFADCCDAVSYLRDHAAELSIDPTAIGAIGGSAGGHLAAMLAVARCQPGGGSIVHGAAVGAAVILYGVGDLMHWIPVADDARLAVASAKIMLGGTPDERPDAYRKASPVYYASSASAPMLMFHGDADEVIDASQSEWFQDRLEDAGADSELIIVPNAPHSFDLHPDGLDIEDRVITFFRDRLFSQSTGDRSAER